MPIRPSVVDIVRECAFDALTSQKVPDDVTPYEEAHGLISYALHRLSSGGDRQAAVNAAKAIVQRLSEEPQECERSANH